MIKCYIHQIESLIKKIETTELQAIEQAAEKVVESINKGGIVQVFGCGHSHMLGEEVFYRAGGLVPVQPIFIEELMLHKGAERSSKLERSHHYTDTFKDQLDIRSEDVLIVASTSGRNPVPIDIALHGNKQGAFVVGVTSLLYNQSQPSRHTNGKLLADVVDLVINNHTEPGDGLLQSGDLSFGPSSSVIGLMIMNAIMAGVIEKLTQQGKTPPIFKSGNIDGSDNHNKQLIKQYKDRIRLF
ncbi:SIS domain-containing protein [Alkalihalophilus sp. As8PL]|uniref:UPF0309 protein AB3N04_19145 n=1 Tax=Alkalihalophilus sp. As8PL TaxID=3237103 RepID=A0AB39BSV0_9BACI